LYLYSDEIRIWEACGSDKSNIRFIIFDFKEHLKLCTIFSALGNTPINGRKTLLT